MESVMISIRPKWCELIASGKKTIEVRKTKPNIEPPFKCYIYCTKGDTYRLSRYVGNGKIIGEFVCDTIFQISITYSDPSSRMAMREFPYTCSTDKQIIDYLGNGKQGYGWHISDLVIYDKPKELSDFKKTNRKCFYADLGFAKRDCEEHQDTDCVITKPPQSWCYCEEAEK